MNNFQEEQPDLAPPPLVRMAASDPELDNLIAQAWDRHVAACLALTIAAEFDLAALEVWNAMGDLPGDSMYLLHSPIGHAQIVNFVAVKLTGEVPADPLVPTIH